MSSSNSHEVSVVYLLPLRLIVGAMFLFAGGSKIASGGLGAAYETTLRESVNTNLEAAFAFYRPFLESVVLPNAAKFAVLLAWSELFIGISIFLGLFTRFGAAAGMFLILNLTLATGQGVWMPTPETMTFWAIFTLFACSAGRSGGVDQVLRSNRKIRLFT